MVRRLEQEIARVVERRDGLAEASEQAGREVRIGATHQVEHDAGVFERAGELLDRTVTAERAVLHPQREQVLVGLADDAARWDAEDRHDLVAVEVDAPDGRDGMLKHATDCAKLNLPFMFDPGQQLPMFSGEELIDFINKASYVAANDYEFEMLMDRTGLTLADIAAKLDALIVTRGEKGSEIYANGECFEIPTVTASAVVDPTGCGDAYRAGLLFGITSGFDWPTTGRLASLMGSIKIASQGGQNHVFTAADIAERFEKEFGYRF